MLDELLREAHGWLEDCGMKVIGREQTIITLVNLHCEGGWFGFICLDSTVDSSLVYLEMSSRYGLDFTNRLYWPGQ